MRIRTILPAALALTALITALGASRPAGAEALKVTPPPIEVRTHQLANGLEILLHEDHSVPVVNLQVIYHVGAKNERPGRTGFAHLFEHIMFKGSANVAPEEHKIYVESVGGRYNAGTDFDRTVYFETFPANYLERFLWLEADRMRSLDVSQENFVSERDVVKEERQLRVETPPFGRLFQIVLDKTFTTHPYRILPIGKVEDLNAASLEDVREFHRTYYVPNNATIVVAGDFDGAQVLKWIEKYFGPIPQGKPVPREIAAEPAQTAERRTVAYDANAPLPAIMLTFHVPEAGHPDLYALEVASNILSAGQSSRLYREMVYEKQMAVAAGGQAVVLEDPGVFFFFTILQGGHAPEEGEKTLLAEIEKLQTQKVSAEELEKSKNQIVSGLVFGRQTAQEKADAIGYAATILDDVSLVDRQLPLYQKVTAEDVQRVAQKYFRPENRTVVHMLPESMREVKP
jgi:zinc protease